MGSTRTGTPVVGRGGKEVGAYDTPPDVVDRLLDLVLDPIIAERAETGTDALASLRVLDPSCGAGNFLRAAGRRIAVALVRSGAAPDIAAATAFGECVAGVDIDTVAVDACRASLVDAAGGQLSAADIARRVHHGDALVAHLPSGWANVDDGIGETGNTDTLPGFELALEPMGDGVDWCELAARPSGDGASDAGFDVVVGNPPFLNPQSQVTSLGSDVLAAIRREFGPAVGALTDPAAMFLVLATHLVRSGGQVCLIEPTSILSVRTAAAARQAISRQCAMVALWVAVDRVFDAAVDVCAPVLGRGGAVDEVALYRGRAVEPVGTTSAYEPLGVTPSPGPHRANTATTPADLSPEQPRPWVEFAATAVGLPERTLVTDGVLGDLASGAADFRDQYYGLAGRVREAEREPVVGGEPRVVRLVTTGLVDPAELAWGVRPARIHRMNFERPVVPLDELDDAMATWATRRLVPKVLVASQTRVIEALVDVEGSLLPSVPLVTVTARSGSADDLWRIAAVLSSPPGTLVAARRHFGASLGRNALKVSATDVMALPLPANQARWDEAADEIRAAHQSTTTADRRSHLLAAARAMLAAYGLATNDDLFPWWANRLPHR